MSTDLDLLVDAARAGGGWAFGRLWTALSPAVVSYLAGRGVRDAEDVTSEVFLAAFRRLPAFEGDGHQFKSWLFTIAHHKAADSWRRGPARREVLTDDPDDRRVTPSAEDEALRRLGSETAELLASLTADQQDVLLLRVIGELSLAEVAALVGKPVGAVKQLQRRALMTLRRNLSGEAITSDDPSAIAGTR